MIRRSRCCAWRHPTLDVVACGGAQGTPRIYKVSELLKRTEAKPDPNLVRAMERQPGPANAIAYSADGAMMAVASTEVRIYGSKDGNRVRVWAGWRERYMVWRLARMGHEFTPLDMTATSGFLT